MLVSFIGIIFHLNNYIQQLQNGQANNISTTTTKQICCFVDQKDHLESTRKQFSLGHFNP